MSTTPWDDKAKEYSTSEIGAHSDEQLVMLENDFITNYLARTRPKRILDIGCGNGQRTKKWANFGEETFGIDSSKEMIKLAVESNQRDDISFALMDVRNLEAVQQYDCVISARCLINLQSEEQQVAVIDRIYNALKPGGYFICVEGSKLGTRNLNNMRELLGIEQIKISPLNLDLSNDVNEYIWSRFPSNIRVDSFGVYYFVTRVMTQVKTMSIESAARIIQSEYGDMMRYDELGRHFCYCGQKE